MTQPPEPAEVDLTHEDPGDDVSPITTEPVAEADDPDLSAEEQQQEAEQNAWMERRSREPRVTIKVQVPTEEVSWEPGISGIGAVKPEHWNAPFTSRPGVGILARQMRFGFTFELADFRKLDCRPGDWLIRDNATGYVFALTDRAFTQLFEAAPPPEPVAGAAEPDAS